MKTFEEYLNERVYKGLKADLTKGDILSDLNAAYKRLDKIDNNWTFDNFIFTFRTHMYTKFEDFFEYVKQVVKEANSETKDEKHTLEFYKLIMNNEDFVRDYWETQKEKKHDKL